MNTPRCSVIIPTLNEEKFIGNLLTSLTQQSEKDFEVIVVDGSSKDKTVDIVNGFKDKLPNLRVVQTKASLPLQRNSGARKAQGEWLFFSDADNVFLPCFFERINWFIKTHHPSLFTTWCSPDSEIGKDALLTLLNNFTVEGSLLLKRNFTPGPLTIVKKDIHNAIGGYDETYGYGEDVDYGRRMKEAGHTMTILRETLYVWSLRRFRKEGTLNIMQKFALSVLSVLLIKRTPKHMPGYIMGGALYTQKKKDRISVVKTYQKKLRKLVRELTDLLNRLS